MPQRTKSDSVRVRTKLRTPDRRAVRPKAGARSPGRANCGDLCVWGCGMANFERPPFMCAGTTGNLVGMFRGSVLAIGAASVLLICIAQGCSSYVKRGSTLYTDGRYIEAAEVFERTEARLADSTPRE